MRLFKKHFDFNSITWKEIQEIRKGDTITFDDPIGDHKNVTLKVQNIIVRLPIDRHGAMIRIIIMFDKWRVYSFDYSNLISCDHRVAIKETVKIL